MSLLIITSVVAVFAVYKHVTTREQLREVMRERVRDLERWELRLQQVQKITVEYERLSIKCGEPVSTNLLRLGIAEDIESVQRKRDMLLSSLRVWTRV